jgi:superfamily II helicase
MPTVKVQILSVGSFYCYLTDNIRPRWVLYGGCLEHLNERLTEDSKHLEKVVQVLPENFAPTPRETVTKFFAVI